MRPPNSKYSVSKSTSCFLSSDILNRVSSLTGRFISFAAARIDELSPQWAVSRFYDIK